MTTKTVNTFPSSDAAFRRVVDRVILENAPSSPHELADRLRPLYPRVAVFERGLEGDRDAYYAFRDGGFTAVGVGRWWEEPGVACVKVSVESGRLTSVSDGWAELMHGDPHALTGHHFSEFVLPEARSVADGMFEAAAHDAEVTSTALVARVDGTTIAIDFHAAREDGEIAVYYRPREGQEADPERS